MPIRGSPGTAFVGGDVLESLRKIEDLERACAAIYAHLGRAFADDLDARQLFVRLAREEKQHAEWVKLVADSLGSHAAVAGLVTAAEAIGGALQHVRALEREALSGAWDCDLRLAATTMARMESDHHLEAWYLDHPALAEAHPEVRDLFQLLDQQNRGHHLELSDFGQRLAALPSAADVPRRATSSVGEHSSGR